MKHSKLILAMIAAGLLLPAAALAHEYTFVDGGVFGRDDRPNNGNGPGDGDDAGVRLAGSAALTRPVALFGELTDSGGFTQLTAGAMYHTALTRVLDLNIGGSLESVDDNGADDLGVGARAGLRWQVLPNPHRLELNPEVRHINVFGETQTSLRSGALYRVARNLDVLGALQAGDEDRVEMGLRYIFTPARSGRPSY